MNLEKIGQIWNGKLLKKIATEMIFKMNIQKRKWAVVEAVLIVPHHIKNQAVISTGNNNNIKELKIIKYQLLSK